MVLRISMILFAQAMAKSKKKFVFEFSCCELTIKLVFDSRSVQSVSNAKAVGLQRLVQRTMPRGLMTSHCVMNAECSWTRETIVQSATQPMRTTIGIAR